MRAAIPAAIGAARVPRRSFKTAYTSKKTKTMSARLRGSINRLKYSEYGSSSNILGYQICTSTMLVSAAATTFLQIHSERETGHVPLECMKVKLRWIISVFRVERKL